MKGQVNRGADSSSPSLCAELSERVFRRANQPILHHVCLFVPDIEASVHFYTQGLGMQVREKFDDIIGIRASTPLYFGVPSVFIAAGEGRYIELHPSGNHPLSPPGMPLNHLALAVSDVDLSYQNGLSNGGKPYGFSLQSEHWDGSPLDVMMSGNRSEPMRMAFLQGPSGELVELYQAAE